jgi:hypothetical protein
MATSTEFDLDLFREKLAEAYPDLLLGSIFRIRQLAENLLPNYQLTYRPQLLAFIEQLSREVCKHMGRWPDAASVTSAHSTTPGHPAWVEYRGEISEIVRLCRGGEEYPEVGPELLLRNLG